MEWVWGFLFGANILLLLLALFFLALTVIAYVFISVGMYKIARKRDMQYPWMAWVPVLRLYLLGLILNNFLPVTPKLKIPYLQYILPGSFAIMYFGSGSFLGGLFTIVSYVLAVLAFSALFRQYGERNAFVYGLLAGLPFVEIIGSIFIFRLGDKPLPPVNADTTVFPEL